MRRLATLTLAALLFIPGSAGSVQAQEVKVGVVLAYTGVGAELGQQVDRGMELFLKLNPDKVKPYAIKLIKRDEKDPAGANTRIAVHENRTGSPLNSYWIEVNPTGISIRGAQRAGDQYFRAG